MRHHTARHTVISSSMSGSEVLLAVSIVVIMKLIEVKRFRLILPRDVMSGACIDNEQVQPL